MISLFAATLTLGVGTLAPPMDMKRYQLVTLEAGKDAPNVEDAALPQLQSAHLAYLESLWKKRQAVLVGPLGDPVRRGLVLLDAPTAEDAKRVMLADPLVKAGFLVPKVMTVTAEREATGFDGEFLDLEPLVIVFFTWNRSRFEETSIEGRYGYRSIADGVRGLRDEIQLRDERPPLFFAFSEDIIRPSELVVLRGMTKDQAIDWAKAFPLVDLGFVDAEAVEFMTTKSAFPKKGQSMASI